MRSGYTTLLKDVCRTRPVALSSMIALIVMGLDYVTGHLVHFPLFHLLPVTLLAWNRYNRLASCFAVVLPLTRIGFHFLWHTEGEIVSAIINAMVSMLVLILFIFLVQRVALQNELLEKRVKVLEGILPICSVCRQIRNEQGQYEPMEQYITEHSEAMFSHGICPICARKFYPEYFQDQ